jgi:hypothetical protein
MSAELVRAANGNGGTLTLSPAQDPVKLGQVLAASGFFADSRSAAQAAVKVMAGAELGFPPIASMTGVYIVKGRVTLSANLIAAAIKRSDKYDYRVKTHSAEACVIEFIEGNRTIGVSEFTMDDAKSAGLAGSDTYKKHPRNMLFARAISNGAKWYCPDVFGGPIYTPDELGEEVDPETGEIQNYTPPPAAEPEPVEAQVVQDPVYLDEDRVAQLYELFKQSNAPADEIKLALIAFGIEGARSVKSGLALLDDEQAAQLEDALLKRIAKNEAA